MKATYTNVLIKQDKLHCLCCGWSVKLQKDFNGLGKWSKPWKMDFNEDKCKVINFWPNTDGTEYNFNIGCSLDSKRCRDLWCVVLKHYGIHTENRSIQYSSLYLGHEIRIQVGRCSSTDVMMLRETMLNWESIHSLGRFATRGMVQN